MDNIASDKRVRVPTTSNNVPAPKAQKNATKSTRRIAVSITTSAVNRSITLLNGTAGAGGWQSMFYVDGLDATSQWNEHTKPKKVQILAAGDVDDHVCSFITIFRNADNKLLSVCSGVENFNFTANCIEKIFGLTGKPFGTLGEGKTSISVWMLPVQIIGDCSDSAAHAVYFAQCVMNGEDPRNLCIGPYKCRANFEKNLESNTIKPSKARGTVLKTQNRYVTLYSDGSSATALAADVVNLFGEAVANPARVNTVSISGTILLEQEIDDVLSVGGGGLPVLGCVNASRPADVDEFADSDINLIDDSGLINTDIDIESVGNVQHANDASSTSRRIIQPVAKKAATETERADLETALELIRNGQQVYKHEDGKLKCVACAAVYLSENMETGKKLKTGKRNRFITGYAVKLNKNNKEIVTHMARTSLWKHTKSDKHTAAVTKLEKATLEKSLVVAPWLTGLTSFMISENGENFRQVEGVVGYIKKFSGLVLNAAEVPNGSRPMTVATLEQMYAVSLEDLLDRINSSTFLQLGLDEVTCSLKKRTYMSVTVRYLNKEINVIQECCIHFYRVTRFRTGKSLADQLAAQLETINFPIDKIISMATDSAPNMAGWKTGLVSHFKRSFPRIEPVTCAAHRLNLAIASSADKLPHFVEALNSVARLTNSINNSTKAVEYIEIVAKECEIPWKSLSTYCNTRWLSRIEQINGFYHNYYVIAKALIENKDNHDVLSLATNQAILSWKLIRLVAFAKDCMVVLQQCMKGLMASNDTCFLGFAQLKSDILGTFTDALDTVKASSAKDALGYLDTPSGLPEFCDASRLLLWLSVSSDDPTFNEICTNCHLKDYHRRLKSFVNDSTAKTRIISKKAFTNTVLQIKEYKGGPIVGEEGNRVCSAMTAVGGDAIIVIEDRRDSDLFSDIVDQYLALLKEQLKTYLTSYDFVADFEIFSPEVFSNPSRVPAFGEKQISKLGLWLSQIPTPDKQTFENEYKQTAVLDRDKLRFEWQHLKTTRTKDVSSQKDATLVLKYICKHESSFPNLATIAKAGLTILDSTVGNERVHSGAKYLRGPRRNRLADKRLMWQLVSKQIFTTKDKSVEEWNALIHRVDEKKVAKAKKDAAERKEANEQKEAEEKRVAQLQEAQQPVNVAEIL